jgi:hypothetical protein
MPMKITTVVKVSVFAATLGFACLLPLTVHAQADAMPSPEDYPFSAPETTAAQAVQPAGATQPKVDFEGKVSLPYGVKCGDKSLKPGQYLLSVKSAGTSRGVTIHGSGESVNIHVREVRSNRAAGQSALLVRKSGDGHRLEGVYVEGLGATLYLDPDRNGGQARTERLPIS